MEVWKVTEDGLLEVSNLGSVRTLPRLCTYERNGKTCTQMRRAKSVRPWLAKNGYLTVSVKGEDGHRRKFTVHRLVAKAFVDGWFEDATVNHIDGNKMHNAAENFEWVSLAENTRKQWEIGLVDLRGEKHPSSKLTNEQTAEIIRRMPEGIDSLATEFNVSKALIYKIRSGKKRVW